LAPFQEDLVHHALDLEDISAREVMVPRPDIFSLPGNLSVTEALDKVVEEQHSRIPVYDPVSGPEHIIGILYAKDVMRWARLRLNANNPQTSAGRLTDMKISQLMHDALVVPETKPLAELLEEFKKRKRHMAIVVDEFGSTAGIITVEDILEQLVGEIEDEYDIAPAGSQFPVEGKTMVLDGTISLRDLESQYELELPRDSGFETLAGFMLSQLQKIPTVGDALTYEGRQFTVDEMDGKRISRVRIETLQPAVAGAGD